MSTISVPEDGCEKTVKFYADLVGKALDKVPSALEGCEMVFYTHSTQVLYKKVELFSIHKDPKSVKISDSVSLCGPRGFHDLRFLLTNTVTLKKEAAETSEGDVMSDLEKKLHRVLSESNKPWLDKVADESYILSLKKEIDDWYNRPWYKKLLNLK